MNLKPVPVRSVGVSPSRRRIIPEPIEKEFIHELMIDLLKNGFDCRFNGSIVITDRRTHWHPELYVNCGIAGDLILVNINSDIEHLKRRLELSIYDDYKTSLAKIMEFIKELRIHPPFMLNNE